MRHGRRKRPTGSGKRRTGSSYGVALLCACMEKGGTTGVLDREITEIEEDREATEELAQPQERKHIGITAKQHSRNETTTSMSI